MTALELNGLNQVSFTLHPRFLTRPRVSRLCPSVFFRVGLAWSCCRVSYSSCNTANCRISQSFSFVRLGAWLTSFLLYVLSTVSLAFRLLNLSKSCWPYAGIIMVCSVPEPRGLEGHVCSIYGSVAHVVTSPPWRCTLLAFACSHPPLYSFIRRPQVSLPGTDIWAIYNRIQIKKDDTRFPLNSPVRKRAPRVIEVCAADNCMQTSKLAFTVLRASPWSSSPSPADLLFWVHQFYLTFSWAWTRALHASPASGFDYMTWSGVYFDCI